jgi:uncharacterized glyoxalase superfamily metalloenzyme YdcJ
VLLRQTSFRALAERRRFREADGTVSSGDLRVRFGEVESRGIALTPAGRDRYDASADLPATEDALLREGFGYFTVEVADPSAATPGADVWTLIDDGAFTVAPIVYEDFLPRSAAGIFQSNLTAEGIKDGAHAGSHRDAAWLAGVLGQDVPDPAELYAAQQEASIDHGRLRVAAATMRAPAAQP